MNRAVKQGPSSQSQGMDAGDGGDAASRAGFEGRSERVKSVVVVPWHPHTVSPEEHISLKSLCRYTEGAELVVATPDGASIPPHLTPARIEVFPAAYFDSFLANNRLMTSKIFYKRFERYDQMLLVHADVLLLKPIAPLLDTLYPWSYVGAPWVGRRKDGSLYLESVGNGGFSIRRIADFLDALCGSSIPAMPRYTNGRNGLALWTFLLGCHVARISRERVSHFMNRHNILEDVYWSRVAQPLSRRFSVAPMSEALMFSYETHPDFLHELNGGKLPYGVHAWSRYDVDFVRKLANL